VHHVEAENAERDAVHGLHDQGPGLQGADEILADPHAQVFVRCVRRGGDHDDLLADGGAHEVLTPDSRASC